jgi:hypothetical protein
MRIRAGVVLAALLAAGCGEPPPADKPGDDTRAVAMVEAAQKMKPPVQPLMPQPIPAGELAGQGVPDSGCRFLRQAGAGDPVAVLGREKGAIRLAGRIVILASDTGSAAMPAATYEKYTGKSHSLQVTRGPGAGEAANGATRWPGSLTIRDPWERIVHFAPGFLSCVG